MKAYRDLFRVDWRAYRASNKQQLMSVLEKPKQEYGFPLTGQRPFPSFCRPGPDVSAPEPRGFSTTGAHDYADSG